MAGLNRGASVASSGPNLSILASLRRRARIGRAAPGCHTEHYRPGAPVGLFITSGSASLLENVLRPRRWPDSTISILASWSAFVLSSCPVLFLFHLFPPFVLVFAYGRLGSGRSSRGEGPPVHRYATCPTETIRSCRQIPKFGFGAHAYLVAAPPDPLAV